MGAEITKNHTGGGLTRPGAAVADRGGYKIGSGNGMVDVTNEVKTSAPKFIGGGKPGDHFTQVTLPQDFGK